MAITAKFLADFDQFVGETKRADAALHGLGTSATTVTTHANSSFAGMGTAMRSVAGAFGVALSVGAVVSFGKSVIDAASDIHDMGLKIGISSEAVQGFKFAAEQAGSTLDAVGTAITRMNVNLSEGDKGTVAALTKAGLQFSAIRAMKPEDAFLAITDAIAQIPDPMTRSEVALQLFGKSAAELLPAIAEGFRTASDGAEKMSNDTIASLEKAQDAWSKLGAGVTIVTGTMIAKVIDFWGVLREQNFGGFGVAAKAAAKDVELLPPVLTKTAEELKATDKAAKDAAKATKDAAEAAEKLQAAWVKANATAVAKMESDVRNAEGMVRMNDAIATQERALQNIEGEWLLYRDAALMATAASDKAAAATAKAWDDVKMHSRTALQETADKAAATYAYVAARAEEFAPDVIEKFRQTAEAAKAAAETWGSSFVGALEAVDQKLVETTQQVVAASASWTQAMAAVSAGAGSMTGTVQAPMTEAQWAKAAQDAGGTVAYDDYNNPYIHVAGQNAPGKRAPGRLEQFAGGGPVLSDGPIYAHKGEFVIPRGGGGGTSVVNHIYVNGTAEDVARKVMAEITRTMKVDRKWP